MQKDFLGFYKMGLIFLFYPSWSQKLEKKIIKGTLHSFKKKKKRILSLIHKVHSVSVATMQSVSICTRLKLSPVVKRVEYPLFMLNANLLLTTNWMSSIHIENTKISTLGVLSATYIHTGDMQYFYNFLFIVFTHIEPVFHLSSRTFIYHPYYKIHPVTFSRVLTDMNMVLQTSCGMVSLTLEAHSKPEPFSLPPPPLLPPPPHTPPHPCFLSHKPI